MSSSQDILFWLSVNNVLLFLVNGTRLFEKQLIPSLTRSMLEFVSLHHSFYRYEIFQQNRNLIGNRCDNVSNKVCLLDDILWEVHTFITDTVILYFITKILMYNIFLLFTMEIFVFYHENIWLKPNISIKMFWLYKLLLYL